MVQASFSPQWGAWNGRVPSRSKESGCLSEQETVMRFSRMLIPTLREDPKDASVVSHRLMYRAGMIRQVAAGIYDLLPLGLRVIRKVETIIREEMDRIGAQEILMPAVQPASLWKESGRWDYYGPELLRFRDRHGNRYVLGPTHEELVTDIMRREVFSHRALPQCLYQIQWKFRDEERPRFGIMRAREFIMKDAYSFDKDEAGAKERYRAMYEAYTRIFTRCGLDFRAVEAATGAIGGSLSHEFQVLAESGEDAILACDHCEYAANVEKAELGAQEAWSGVVPEGEPELVETPDAHRVQEVAVFMGLAAKDIVKTLIYEVDGRFVALLVRGDHEVSDAKLQTLLTADRVGLADDQATREVTGAPVGFAGPIGLPEDVEIIADHAVAGMSNFVVGANQADRHYRSVYLGRDFAVSRFADLRAAAEGDRCPRCGSGTYRLHRGIEVGQVFYLGTKYSSRMGASFLDEDGTKRPMVMGCYGIGVGRTAAAAIEQHHDDRGIVWPMSIAPFQVTVLALQMNDERVVSVARGLYEDLQGAGVEVLLDDRKERAGVKFNDADLIGIPVRVAVGKKGVAEGTVEVKLRGSQEIRKVPLEAASGVITRMVREALEALEP